MEIFNDITSLTYILAVGFLGLWFLFSGSRKWNMVMGIGFFLSLMGNFILTMSMSFGPVKYFIFSKNLILIGFFGFVFMLLRKNKIGLFMAIVSSIIVSIYLLRLNLEVDLLPSKINQNLELGELLIEANPDQVVAISEAIAEYEGRIARAFHPARSGTSLDHFYLIDMPDEISDKKNDLLALLLSQDLIRYGEVNDVIQLKPLSPDPTKGHKTTMRINDPLSEQQWALDALNMEEWYELLIDHHDQAIETAVVAVLDTGIDGQHEDLSHMLDKSYRSETDPVGHGTHCAGIMAAETNNRKGIASMAFHDNLISLMPVKVLNRFGFGTQAQIIKGMIRAVDEGADVLSMSLGGISDAPKQKAYLAAVEYAAGSNAVVITSAGNSSASARGFTPANVPGVICVTALDEELHLAGFSNYLDGIEWGLSAPGVNIMSTYPGNQYKPLSGTSMAAPFVSSTVGILKSFAPELSPAEIYNILHHSSKSLPDAERAGGMLQPAAALQMVLSRM